MGAAALHWWSLGVFMTQLLGYVALSTALEWGWYHRRRGNRQTWKIQPGTDGTEASRTPPRRAPAGEHATRGESGVTCVAYAWGLPAIDLLGRLLSGATVGGGDVAAGGDDTSTSCHGAGGRQRAKRPPLRRHERPGGRRHPSHALFATVNLVVSALFAGAVTELSLRGQTQLYTGALGDAGDGSGWVRVGVAAWALVKAVTWQSVWEYYWHRLMHHPPVYRALHKYHHHYKSPQPWDDLFIHPIEAFGYYVILYSPAFCVGAVPVASFLAYMALMGTCGVLDHCGVDLCVVAPAVYNTRFHDLHHKLTRVNYAFPFPAMDIVHGTFRAE